MVTPLLLLICDSLSGTLTSSRIGLSALSTNRQTFSVTDATVAVRLNKALNVHRNFAAEFAFYGVVVFDLVTELRNIILSQILCAGVRIDTGFSQDIFGALRTDSLNVGQRDLDAFGIRNINTGYTSHYLFTSFEFF